MIIDKLIEKIKETQNPSVVGLDPRFDMVPAIIREKNLSLYGESFKAVAKSYLDFNIALIDEIHDIIPAVKPQIAMYEQLGTDGISAFIDTCNYANSKNLIVIGDIKRSDIASTAESYSDGHIGQTKVGSSSLTAFNEDFITLNPYLGYDSIEPYIDNCKKFEKGMFVLVKTSNPNSGEIQDLITISGKTVHEEVALLVEKWGEELLGKYNYSSIGAVVGATHPDQSKNLRKLMPKTFFLVPGYGAQGATASDLSHCFDKDGLGAIVNSSRGIIAAYKIDKYKKDFKENEFAKAARQAVLDMKKDLNNAMNK